MLKNRCDTLFMFRGFFVSIPTAWAYPLLRQDLRRQVNLGKKGAKGMFPRAAFPSGSLPHNRKGIPANY